MDEFNYVYPPPSFVPYLEKYRIYELFQSFTAELIIASPKDHILFLKSVLMRMVKNGRDLHKILIIASPKLNIDVSQLAHRMAEELHIPFLTREEILEPYQQLIESQAYYLQSEALAEVVLEKLKSVPYKGKGWIMCDYPSSPEEAYAAQRAGILPNSSLWLMGPDDKVVDSVPGSRTQELSRIYWATLKEINVKNLSTERLLMMCCAAARKKSPSGMPSIYRVVILGPAGCGRHEQARALADTFHLVHVNFQYLYRQAGLRTDDIGKKIKTCQVKKDDLLELLRRRLYQKDCLEQGWVLTHFPRRLKEFEYLDRMDTPPNRVIFLTISQEECKKRIIEHDLKGSFQYSEFRTMNKLKEVEEYFKNEFSLRHYSGKTAAIVDASGSAELIQSGIQEAVMSIPTADIIRGVEVVTQTTSHYDSSLELFYPHYMMDEGSQ